MINIPIAFQEDTVDIIKYRARQRGITNADFLASAVRLVDLVADDLRKGSTLILQRPDGSFERIVNPVG